jgi:hypothetical protein
MRWMAHQMPVMMPKKTALKNSMTRMFRKVVVFFAIPAWLS